MVPFPADYVERVYAGVLGKIIGVYLGRPFEGWPYEKIMAELGEINYYVHEQRRVPLVVTDDDIAGTFAFVRALADHGSWRELTSEQIGQAWLNYIIENRSILWWGGLGNSTEHTAFMRLKQGIPAPRSGSIALNGKTVAEQIGAQIFIDGWAMVSPGDPELATELAGKAARVSHDGEAVYAAQLLAAMEAQAFTEPDLQRLIDCSLGFIPRQSTVYRLVNDLREWHTAEPDWRKTREKIAACYGYDKYLGNCHMIPNHALIHLALLYGGNDFQKTLMIVNTSGWDTDCNSGNVGCLMGIKNGLAGIDAGPDWRGPVADRLYIPTADSGRVIMDAVTQAYELANSGRALVGLPLLAPKNGARFHFELPGAVQGFTSEDTPETRGTVQLSNTIGHSHLGRRSLALKYHSLAPGRIARVSTATFLSPESASMPSYGLMASPILHPGQTLHAEVAADEANQRAVTCGLYLRYYGAEDHYLLLEGERVTLPPGERREFHWQIGDLDGAPIAAVGIQVLSSSPASGIVYLDYLTWDGTPRLEFKRPQESGQMWRRAWVNGVDDWSPGWFEDYRLVQNEGTGLIIQGTRQWSDYQVQAIVKPLLMSSGGVAGRVQGLRRYYALLLSRPGKAQLVKWLDSKIVLAEKDFAWEFDRSYDLCLKMAGDRLQGWVDDCLLFDLEDAVEPITCGGIGLAVEEGSLACKHIRVQ
jgi:ADP-ribosylglycohydrolase